ncbi:alpha/beta hydrolase-fold protein [Spongiivirga sp. MCCC 1A20706]|uniref:alpha/beta hydrolase n=1 Tax=Spongiivirga sp. MCCC 1A20706 TaxID=3160963 RepID=UPI003977A5EE
MKKILILLLVCSTSMNAQVLNEEFNSYKLGETRKIDIYIPESYSAEDKKTYPLVIVLDGDYLFDLAVSNTKLYSYWEEMPEAIVVGVQQENVRIGDTKYNDDSGLPEERGAAFFEFIAMELVPYITKGYKTANFKMIVGHDRTAAFLNYYLFKEDPMFDAYVSLAPKFAPFMEERLADKLNGTEKRRFYYLATGENDDKRGRKAIKALNDKVKTSTNENLSFYFDEFANAGENAVAGYGIASAMDQIFGMYKPISVKEYRENIATMESDVFSYLEKKYNDIETFFGFRKQTTMNDIMAIYAAAKKKEDLESLQKLGVLGLKEYPDTMLGHFFEAEFHELSGEPKKALRTYEKAFGSSEIDFLTKDLVLERIDALKADFGY